MKPKTKLIMFLLLAAALVTTGFRCTFIKSKQERQALQPVSINYWRVWEGRNEMADIIGLYRHLHPNIIVDVRTLRFEEYEKEILEAFAKDKAPDIISLHSTWLGKYISNERLNPMPKEVSMAYQIQKKSLGIKKETIVEFKTTPTPTIGQIQQQFIDTVAKDVIWNNQIYGLPLSVDSMVLYYNRDLLNSAGLPLPPADWQEFQKYVKQLTFFDQNRQIAISGAALGSADNIRRSTDILALLMMQNGSVMITESGQTAFHTIPPNFSDDTYHPGIEALRFYLDFADPTKEVYAWNNDRDDALLEFARNNVAMYFGYSYDYPEIIASSKGNINLGITPIPQISRNSVNIANYWVETVSSKTKNKNEAWDFILFAANEKNVGTFLKRAKRPTALRALIEKQNQDDFMRPFVSQLLTAKTWYRGNDANAAEEIMKELIRSVAEGEKPNQAINFAAQRVQQTIFKK